MHMNDLHCRLLVHVVFGRLVELDDPIKHLIAVAEQLLALLPQPVLLFFFELPPHSLFLFSELSGFSSIFEESHQFVLNFLLLILLILVRVVGLQFLFSQAIGLLLVNTVIVILVVVSVALVERGEAD
jgi:hypothetical protein